MPFNVTLHAWKPSDDWRAKKPPVLIVPPHIENYKTPRRFKLTVLANAYTYSTSDMAQVFGGTWQAWRIFKDREKVEYAEWSDEDLPLLRWMKLWAAMYPLAWFQNG